MDGIVDQATGKERRISRGRRKSFVQENMQNDTGVELELRNQISQFEEYRQSLTDEIAEWIRIQEKETNLSQKAVEKTDQSISFEECSLSMAKQNFIEKRPNYSQMLKQMRQKLTILPALAEKAKNDLKILDDCLEQVQRIADEKIDKFLENNDRLALPANQATSQELIHRLAELR